MNIQLTLPRAVLFALALAVGPACASNGEMSPRKDAALAGTPRGCGAARAETAVRVAPPPPVVGMCR